MCGRRRTLRGMCVGEEETLRGMCVGEEHNVELGLHLKTSHYK